MVLGSMEVVLGCTVVVLGCDMLLVVHTVCVAVLAMQWWWYWVVYIGLYDGGIGL